MDVQKKRLIVFQLFYYPYSYYTKPDFNLSTKDA
jgi:hypothetical protein